MRDVSSLEPQWEVDSEPGLRMRILLGGASIAARLIRGIAPRAFHFARGQRPSLSIGWGTREYRIGREGLERRRRSEAGWEDNPRSNYNEAVAKKQAKSAKKAL